MPRVSVLTPGGLKEVTRWQGLHLGVVRLFRTLRVMDASELRYVGSFIPPISLSVAPGEAFGGAFGGQVTTNTVTASVSGGQSPYSYAWSLISNNNPGTPFATNPANATSAFSGLVGGDAVFRVTATDALGSVTSADIFVNFASYA